MHACQALVKFVITEVPKIKNKDFHMMFLVFSKKQQVSNTKKYLKIFLSCKGSKSLIE